MNISENVSLAKYSTMRLGGTARYALEIHSNEELADAVKWAKSQNIDIIMVGGGSNIVWSDEGFSGLLLINRIKQFKLEKHGDGTFTLIIGAGEIWDNVVERAVNEGANGIEALSLIPGTAGATPIQNVGAYGQEIAQTLISVEAYDRSVDKFVTISKTDCNFSYRSSRFKTTDKGRFLITRITLRLTTAVPYPPYYPEVQQYLEQHLIHYPTGQILRNAVVDIRNSKLPDPAKIANNGSFFANPIVERQKFLEIKERFPNIAHWLVDDNHEKLSAAWMIEHAGFKNVHDEITGMATWEKQALILINEHAHKTADLLKFKQKIVNAVKEKYGIELIQEPELLP